MYEATAGAMAMNAQEAWSIYDAIQIRNAFKGEVFGRLGYNSYQAAAAVDEWPFFDQRKSDIGLAYTNRDSNEGLEFVFHAYSLGVRFVAPSGKVEPMVEAKGPSNPLAHAIFNAMAPEHCGLILKISQDDKLLHTVTLAPDGAGPGPVSIAYGAGQAYGATYANANGFAELSNRWKWPVPISIPRGATFSVRLKPSLYLKRLMAAMPGPGGYTFSDDQGVEETIPACALIRVDLIGKREVQQRNQLHY
jgi:hypothetical protein